MLYECNDRHLGIEELDEFTRRADRPQGIESHLFHYRTGAKRAISERPGHSDKYSTWPVEVVYLVHYRSRPTHLYDKAGNIAARTSCKGRPDQDWWILEGIQPYAPALHRLPLWMQLLLRKPVQRSPLLQRRHGVGKLRLSQSRNRRTT